MRPWKATPCAPEHLLQLVARNGHQGDVDRVGRLLERQRYELADHARTLWMGSIPVGALGVVEAPLGGNAEAWAVLSEEIAKHPVSIVREARALIAEAWRVLPALHRLQALCAKDDGIAYRFLGACGFQDEAVLHRFGPRGEDMVMFAMFGPPQRRGH